MAAVKKVKKVKASGATAPAAPSESDVQASVDAIPDELILRSLIKETILWDDPHKETGAALLKKVGEVAARMDTGALAREVIRTKEVMKDASASLFLARQLARRQGKIVGDTIKTVITKPGDMTAFLGIYWTDENGKVVKTPLSKQVKRGLSLAFAELDLRKADDPGEPVKGVRLRDIMFLTHPKPADAPDRRLTAKERKAGIYPDTDKEFAQMTVANGVANRHVSWEAELAASTDKVRGWEMILLKGNISDSALLRNLRRVINSGVSERTIRSALESRHYKGVPGHLIVEAARVAPQLVTTLQNCLSMSLRDEPKLSGRTLVIIDSSSSMMRPLKPNTTVTRLTEAFNLAAHISTAANMCYVVCTAGKWTNHVPDGHCSTLIDALTFNLSSKRVIPELRKVIGYNGIFLNECLDWVKREGFTKDGYERVVVFTDDADCDKGNSRSKTPAEKLGKWNYIVNLAAEQDKTYTRDGWLRVDGFSQRLVDWIRAEESQ